MNLNRRKVLSWFGLGWLASLLPSSLIGCSEATTPTASSPTSSASAAPESVAAAPSGSFKTIGTVAQLDKAGSLLSADKQVAVVRDPQDAKKLLAVNPTCTHKGCIVAWQPSGEYVCPCHQAKYSPTETVLGTGPTTVPLKVLQAKIEGDAVLVKANA